MLAPNEGIIFRLFWYLAVAISDLFLWAGLLQNLEICRKVKIELINALYRHCEQRYSAPEGWILNILNVFHRNSSLRNKTRKQANINIAVFPSLTCNFCTRTLLRFYKMSRFWGRLRYALDFLYMQVSMTFWVFEPKIGQFRII